MTNIEKTTLKPKSEKEKITFQQAINIGLESQKLITTIQKSVKHIIDDENPDYPNTRLVKTKDLESIHKLLLLCDRDLLQAFDKLKNVNDAIDYWKDQYQVASNQFLKMCKIKDHVAA